MTKKKQKYKLSFINNGKPFELKDWTVEKHEAVLKETAKFQKSMNEKDLDKKYRNILVLKGLKEIDSSVTEEKIVTMHPDDILAMFSAIYLQGKRGILADDDDNFRSKNSKKKTSTK